MAIVERHGDDYMTALGEEVAGNFAQVRSRIAPEQGLDVGIEYRLSQRGSQWMVYDVVIDSMSLVSNYRNQFNSSGLLRLRSSYSGCERRVHGDHRAVSRSTARPSKSRRLLESAWSLASFSAWRHTHDGDDLWSESPGATCRFDENVGHLVAGHRRWDQGPIGEPTRLD